MIDIRIYCTHIDAIAEKKTNDRTNFSDQTYSMS